MKTIVIDDYLDKDVYDMLYKMYQSTKAGSDVKRTMFDHDPTPQIADLINEFTNKREYDKLAKFIHTADYVCYCLYRTRKGTRHYILY